jgi:protoporphyrinogen oxidase
MTMAARDVDCLVIGGGISGLTTAFYADKVLIEFPSQPQFVLFSRTTRTIALRWR